MNVRDIDRGHGAKGVPPPSANPRRSFSGRRKAARKKKKKTSEPPFSLSLSELARRRLGQRTRYPQNHTQTGGEVCSPPPAEEGGLEVAPLLAPLALEDKALLTSRAVGRLREPASSSRSSIDVPSFFFFFFFWAGAFPAGKHAHFSVYFFCREMRERERSSFAGRAGGWRRPSSRATGGRACRGREVSG